MISSGQFVFKIVLEGSYKTDAAHDMDSTVTWLTDDAGDQEITRGLLEAKMAPMLSLIWLKLCFLPENKIQKSVWLSSEMVLLHF